MADPITALPTPPTTSDPDNFDSRADAFLAALVTFVTETNAVAAAMNLNATSGSSATSNSIGTGAKTFTADTGKSWLGGMFIVIADNAAPSTNSMLAQVTSYNSGTGELIVDVKATLGSGTKTAWTISQTANPVPLDNSVATAALQAKSVTYAKIAFDGGSFGTRNRLINPRGAIYQIAVAATADDTYFADGWYMLTQTGTVTPSKLTDPEDGFPSGIRITQSQASAQRFGFAQIIESVNCKDMRGGPVVTVPRIRVSNSQAIRYAILGWSGTADAVTSDVVNDWTSSSYTAGGFFNSTTLSVIAVGSQTPSAATWTSLAELTASAGSTFNNLIVMIWTEGTAAQNFTLDFDYVQIEKGSTFTAFDYRDRDKEITLCQRYAEKSYNLTVDPGTAANEGAEFVVGNANATASARGNSSIRFKTRKFTAPTVTVYSTSDGASGNVRDLTGAANRTATIDSIGEAAARVIPDTLSSDARYAFQWLALSRL